MKDIEERWWKLPLEWQTIIVREKWNGHHRGGCPVFSDFSAERPQQLEHHRDDDVYGSLPDNGIRRLIKIVDRPETGIPECLVDEISSLYNNNRDGVLKVVQIAAMKMLEVAPAQKHAEINVSEIAAARSLLKLSDALGPIEDLALDAQRTLEDRANAAPLVIGDFGGTSETEAVDALQKSIRTIRRCAENLSRVNDDLRKLEQDGRNPSRIGGSINTWDRASALAVKFVFGLSTGMGDYNSEGDGRATFFVQTLVQHVVPNVRGRSRMISQHVAKAALVWAQQQTRS